MLLPKSFCTYVLKTSIEQYVLQHRRYIPSHLITNALRIGQYLPHPWSQKLLLLDLDNLRACMALGTQQQSGMKIVLYFTLYKQQSYRMAMMFRRWNAVKCFRSLLEQLAKDFPSFCGRDRLTKSIIMKTTHGARCAIRNLMMS